jgi:hypothetical protein
MLVIATGVPNLENLAFLPFFQAAFVKDKAAA